MDNLGDLSAMLAPLLNDPDTMSSLRQAAEQMGLGGLLPDSSAAAEEDSTSGKPSNLSNAQSAPEPQPAAELLSAVSRLAPLLSAPQEDDTSRLLTALRPFLSHARAEKLDQAERMLSVTRMLSILKESKLM